MRSFHIICADPKTSSHEIKTRLVPATDLAPDVTERGVWRREKERDREGGGEERGWKEKEREREERK